MNNGREDYAVAAVWTEYRKVIGDKLSPIEMSEPWTQFGSARAAAMTAAEARRRDLEADEAIDDPVVWVMRRHISIDTAGDDVTRSPWAVLLELGAVPTQEVLT